MAQSGTPVWRSIRDTLASEIAQQGLRPGDRLPTEAQLSARFGVNRHTLRRAVASLVDEGLLRARRGSGVFVAMQPVEYAIGRHVSFHQNLALAGRLPGRRVNVTARRPADPVEAQALRILAGEEVWVSEGVSTADDQPIALYRTVFPAARFPGLDERLSRLSSVTAALNEAGLAEFLRAETRISAQTVTVAQALLLNAQEGQPLIVTQSVNTDMQGVPVEYGTTWFLSERVTLITRSEI
ncbi:phosphonate metabolism transcriptional regulator PhnF [Paracoccus sulfuroxidans]|uniref:GntR family phosphonate transport system transcriptional regulator n=1 Tax=Paracoccus sulfuroxidans TaxID=384678 RepID=A0A562NST9_9RHOB|nr:phosphonate metabolism transcriptional regulator PhnF [Paracoccus sulfuroxidans]TWI35120.1 GntR family phosphonate transport system transcriptional regulator [Paracoccus sulfuroxidans]